MELQVYVGTPEHAIEIGFMENIETDLDIKLLEESGQKSWQDLAYSKQQEEKFEEAIKYFS